MTIALTARKLRLILSAALVPLVAAGVGLFLLGYNQILMPAAQSASAAATTAKQGDDEETNLQQTKRALALNAQAIQRAQNIVAKSTQYKYQEQVANDIYTLAQNAGIGISGITYASASPAASTPTAPAAGSSSGTASASGQASAGLKTTTVTIALINPLPYDNFLRFLYSIEQNATKMRIENVSMSAATSANGSTSNAITSNALTIEVYLDGGK